MHPLIHFLIVTLITLTLLPLDPPRISPHSPPPFIPPLNPLWTPSFTTPSITSPSCTLLYTHPSHATPSPPTHLMCHRYPADMAGIRNKWRWIEDKRKEEEHRWALAMAEDKDTDDQGGSGHQTSF